MHEAMKAEFDTVAEWTAEVALELGSDYFLPAGCRGSGSPATLRWLIDRLRITKQDRMLDCGAGVGGPAAFAALEVGVKPMLSDPEAGACRGARRLFGLPAVQAASDLPFRSGSMDVIWCLGVLCTVDDQQRLLDEFRRVLTPAGRLGLLVFVADRPPLSKQPAGNNFGTETELRELIEGSQLRIQNSASLPDFEVSPTVWQERVDAVNAELSRRHHDDPTWQTAAAQSQVMGELLADGELVGTMIVARPEPGCLDVD